MNGKAIGAVTSIILTIVAVCTFLWGSGILSKSAQETNQPRQNTDKHEYNTYTDPVVNTKPYNNNTQSTDNEKTNNKANGNSVKLFSLPVYAEVGKIISNQRDTKDVNGFPHEDVYVLRPTYVNYSNREHVTYALNGEYKTIKGTIWEEEFYVSGVTGELWLEFYGDDTLLYTTNHTDSDVISADFEFDVSGINVLMIKAYSCDVSGCQIIADITVYK